MVRWSGGQVVRWSGGQVVRWSGGQVVRWSGGQVVRWSGDCITVENFGKVFPLAKGHTTAKPSMWF
ncbi:hypothetical protein ACFODO_04760 [Acinetobacter sichuanensis]|uniref:Uncharacterized protein n=1 Tax=Acinetobacter sichuanensis TaxID=2136183 RepID=A0ABV7BED7_9GAMM